MSLPLKVEVTWQTSQRSWLVQQELEVLPCTVARSLSLYCCLVSTVSGQGHQSHVNNIGHRYSVIQSCADNLVSLCASLLQASLKFWWPK